MTATALTSDQIELIAATRPILEKHGLAITTRMYQRLFEAHPEVADMFTTPGQEERLAVAVLAYCDNIANLDAILPVVKNIGRRHVEAGVEPSQYAIVGDHLLGAMVDVLGELDPMILDAWSAAYGLLADTFIAIEDELRAEVAVA